MSTVVVTTNKRANERMSNNQSGECGLAPAVWTRGGACARAQVARKGAPRKGCRPSRKGSQQGEEDQ